MKKITFILTVGILIHVFCFQPLYAGDVEILLDKLVESGILTDDQAEFILDKIKENIDGEKSSQTNGNLPRWIHNVKLKGDLRLRYQWNKKETEVDRHRGRYRFRWGAKTKVVDKVKAGFGFASGGTDPRSTNQTMTNSFETPDVRLDYAYAEYAATPCLTLYGGKFPRKPVLWQPSDLLWDSDINTEGLAVAFNISVNHGLDLLLNTGIYIIDERSDEPSDPILYVAQPRLVFKITRNIEVKAALGYYEFDGVKGTSLDHSEETNSLDTTGQLIYNYSSINPSIELGLKKPFNGLLPYFALMGDYVYNPDPANDNTGYLMGIKFGNQSVKKELQWQLKYLYRHLEKDAWLDTFPDSDFYGGATDVQGHEIILDIGLAKNVSLVLDYYLNKNITGTENQENLFQFDLNFKF